MFKKLIAWSLVMFISIISFSNLRAQVFFDDFRKNNVDTSAWSVMNMIWGEQETHGGVVPDNISTSKGKLVVRALGNYYKGTVKGHGQNTRVGGAIVTKRKFASGSYEVRAKICPRPGALSAFWTFYYENDSCNHEIDFEFPGHNQKPLSAADSRLDWGLVSNWRGVADSMRSTTDMYFGNHTDNKFHLYRFDWHTGSATQKPRVEWYFDNKLMHTSYIHVPTKAAAFNVGIWFPTWIPEANFNTDFMYVDWVKITPFNEDNDE